MTRFAHPTQALAACEAVAVRQLRRLVDFGQVTALEQALVGELRALTAAGELGPPVDLGDLDVAARKLVDAAWLRATRATAADARDRADAPPRAIDREEPELWS